MTPSTLAPKKERLNGIDSTRYRAAAIVVLGHSYKAEYAFLVFINNTLRVVVPFFFLTSGYMLTQKLLKNDHPSVYLKYVGRILLLYLSWSVIHFAVVPLNNIQELGILGAYTSSWNELSMPAHKRCSSKVSRSTSGSS